MHKRKKSYFTLVEMMVVVFIISLGLAITGVKLKEAYDEQRFLSEAEQVVNTMALAQDLMLIMDADVSFHLENKSDKKVFICWIEVDKPLKKPWDKMVERKHELNAIKSVKYDAQDTSKLDLNFSLGSMSHGKIVLSSMKEEDKKNKDALKFEINLPDYPSPFFARQSKLKKHQEFDFQIENLYPTVIYDEIYEKNK